MTCNSPRSLLASNRFMKTQGVKNKIKLLLGSLCCLLFLFLTVLSIPVYAFRVLVISLAKIFRPDLGGILNGLSSVLANDYFYNSKYPRTSVVVSVVIQGQDIPSQKFKEVFLERWIRAKDNRTGKLTFEQFQQYPVRWMGFTFWKKCMDTFNINNHVFVEDERDSDGVDDEKLNNICEKLLNAPYPPNQSPWEVHLVKNYKSDQLSIPNISRDETTNVILFKVHHCLADGYSMLNALVEGLGQHYLTPLKLPVPPSPERSFWKNITYGIYLPFSAFYEISYALSHTFRSSPWKVPDNKKEWYQICAKSEFIPIQKIKFIKTQLHVSFTSVLLSAISSAICQSVKNEKQKSFVRKSDENHQNSKNDRSMYFLSVLPLPGHPNGLTNHCTVALFDLPVDEYDSSVDRLHDVDIILESTKNTNLPAIVALYNSAIGCNFYSVGNLIGKQRMVAAGLTNFPTMPNKIELFGSKWVAADFVVGALDGVEGVRIMVLSHGEYIRVAVSVEKAVMSKDEANLFVKNVMKEIDLLFKMAMCCSQRTTRDKNLAVG